MNVFESLQNKTVLPISHGILNPVMAIQTTLQIYQDSTIPVPPKNVRLQIIWFYQKRKPFQYRTFVIINQPTPPESQIIQNLDIQLLADSFDMAQGNYFETKESVNIAVFKE